MARSTHHVVHNPNGGWDVKRAELNAPVATIPLKSRQ